MAIRIQCGDPGSLLADMRSKTREGILFPWAVDSDGDFTMPSEDKASRAWMRPKVGEGELAFFILGTKAKNVSRIVYGTYHARLIEAILNHFDQRFIRVYASAMPEPGDRVSPSQ